MGAAVDSANLVNLVDSNTTNLANKFFEKGQLVQSLFRNADKYAKIARSKTEEARKLGVTL
eukprot:CAMPEP_0116929414 /NCGR_PEP_ID=MMETSP0467-20121206/26564_1 /TAXON_ID=283647 /ORGANISM="Mesodinium pulex, Strain SPMC105" /LENGTH=60 /DNA_ID=CAMNT_0004609373 /DNA_START=128 /DNA_END=310 /DNA_ORIENTATION=-